ncbi:hypothetical protein FRC06_000409 [Ceratobasidium sp. 370]|nr:hypothetical protein FRC06_000409 [Ceratobasidium sp. 370]
MVLIDESLSLPSVCMRHGRQFHDTNSNYVLPNDEEEHKRLSYQHEAIKIMVGGNYVAPLPQLNAAAGPRSVLDVCSGSGQWVLEMAQEFPLAKVVGIDLSKPALGREPAIPPNASFVVGDIKRAFPFESASFDVVHMRMVPSIQERTAIYKEMHRVLRPGGLILLDEPGERVSHAGSRLPPELVVLSNATVATSHFHEIQSPAPDQPRTGSEEDAWALATRIASDLRGSPSMWANIREEKFAVPMGVWTDDEAGQKAGKFAQYCISGLFKSMRPAIVDVGVLTGDQVDDLIVRLGMKLELEAKQWQVEWPFCFVWAEKH